MNGCHGCHQEKNPWKLRIKSIKLLFGATSFDPCLYVLLRFGVMVAARHPSDVMEEWKDQIISNLPMKQQTQTQNIDKYRVFRDL